MATLGRISDRVAGWSLLQRKAVNLAPTTSTCGSGMPIAGRINFLAPVPHEEHIDESHDEANKRTRRDIAYVPAWSANIQICGPLGLRLRNAMAVSPTLPFQARLFSSSSRRSIHIPQPQVPDYSEYINSRDETTGRAVSYVAVGATGVLALASTKALVGDFLKTMSASADVLALGKAEIDLASIPLGKNIIIKWRGKPVFIRHRTPEEIEEANKVDISKLRDPEKDSDRVKKPEWLVILGVCTHLGCVPVGEAGDYGGWFCPCHGSHYDISGRARKGPAPLNLEVPEYSFPEEGKLVIG